MKRIRQLGIRAEQEAQKYILAVENNRNWHGAYELLREQEIRHMQNLVKIVCGPLVCEED